MERGKVLFFDFDGVYKHKTPTPTTLIITNLYHSDNNKIYNVNSNVQAWSEINKEFELFIELIDKELIKSLYSDIEELKIYLFISFFYPLGQWISTINSLLKNGIIDLETEIHFSSYCKNEKVFVFEAEGEVNKNFLYKKSFFLSYYIKSYLESKGFKRFVLLKDMTLRANVSFFLRGVIVLCAKTVQILFYKWFTFKRNYIEKGNKRNVVLSRGIIQTQFISNLYKKYNDNILLLINESSSKPYRNLKEARKLGDYYYAEGNITLKQLGGEFLRVLKAYLLINKNLPSKFFGVHINIINLIPEISIKHFHCRTYAHMAINSLEKLKIHNKNVKQIISMEMLPPFSLYIKKFSSARTVQLQTTSMFCAPYPKFTYVDKFYFSDINTYEQFVNLELDYGEKFDVVNNIKYIGVEKSLKNTVIKTLTYFSQPIYLDEENELILYLKRFCELMNFNFKIKFHPRAKIPTLDLKDVEIIPVTYNSVDVVKNSDIVVTRTSSIAVDCWFLNKPILFFVNGTMTSNNTSYIPNDYLGTIKEKITVEELASNLNSILDNFYNHRLHKKYKVNESLIVRKILHYE